MAKVERGLDFDSRQTAAIEVMLADMAPEDELANRMALHGMFMRGRDRHGARIDELAMRGSSQSI